MSSGRLGLLGMLGGLVGLLALAYHKNPRLIWEGARDGGKAFLQVLPAMVVAFMAAALVSKLIPQEVVNRWLSERSGGRGLAVATLAGSLTPGGPFVQFPIVAALYESGVGVGPLAAYLSAWALLGIHRLLIFELPLLGWKFSLCRFLATLLCPPAIGYVTQCVWNRLMR
uniref:Permease n=1 Tax=Desulfacinum infernum TaxID=35837 RepID=A0A832EEM2_9BACT